MPMEMDPSVGQDPADEVKRLTQLSRVRGRSSGGARSTATRPTYAQPSPDPRDVSGIYPGTVRQGNNPDPSFDPGTPMSPSDAKARGLGESSAISDPSSIYFDRSQGAQPQGQDMAGAYQKLLHSVAIQNGGSPPSGGSQPTPSNGPVGDQHKQAFQDLIHSVAIQNGGRSPSGDGPSSARAGSSGPPSGNPAQQDNRVGSQWAPGTPRNLFTGVVPKDPQQAGALWGERQRAVERTDKEDKEQSDNKSSSTSIKPPPNIPPSGSSKEVMDRYRDELKASHEDISYHLALAKLESTEGAAATKASLSAVNTEHTVLSKELKAAQDKAEKNSNWLGSAKPEDTKAVDKIQSLLDRIKAKRDKLIKDTLDDEGGDDKQDSESNITEEEYNALPSGASFMHDGKQGWKP